MDTSVAKLLNEKNQDILTAAPSMSVYDCTLMMAEKNIGALPIVENNALVGIFTERDLMLKVVKERKNPEALAVNEVMTKEVIYIHKNSSLNEAMAIMTDQRIRHIPLLEDGQLVGMISIGDITHWLSLNYDRQKYELNVLNDYVNNRGYS
ncbi:Hypoxic response protein 1 [Piscirickettsia salmonis]|uniref:CBS domain-containing protein n=1 Tax=Piscirickettsia salmonis TaxID=1238 RepID=UPI000F0751FE|nr:CBS domain-containing protein [Piscirickettsia salmonis]QGP50498.1 Hypoxic response protein 1 [Piscirickettsia salmonis]RNC77360.1 CBS domain-containing protein [Piscirickettsiaceae bacterium NZ-RLO2]